MFLHLHVADLFQNIHQKNSPFCPPKQDRSENRLFGNPIASGHDISPANILFTTLFLNGQDERLKFSPGTQFHCEMNVTTKNVQPNWWFVGHIHCSDKLVQTRAVAHNSLSELSNADTEYANIGRDAWWQCVHTYQWSNLKQHYDVLRALKIIGFG